MNKNTQLTAAQGQNVRIVNGYEIKPRAKLSYTDLSYADLTGADLRGADLTGADLRGANLSYVDLTGANLRGADLRGANLSYVDLTGADLTGADLTGANLTGANLSDANLSDANLPNGFGKPKSFTDALTKVKKWLTKERWIKESWIKTPNGAYSGTCQACLHGAALYVGGEYGKEISNKLIEKDFTPRWNDKMDRTFEDIQKALDSI